jgi:SAM-dependent methyltransferase
VSIDFLHVFAATFPPTSTNNPMDDEPRDEKAVIEEDWSEFMNFNPTGTGFSQHASLKIPLSSTVEMDIACIEHLTPIDMMNLSYGTSDSTGNRVWMGAFAFMEVFARPLPSYHGEEESEVSKTAKELKMLRYKLFHSANILELGSGTGVSGISLMLAHQSDEQELSYIPSRITFTDNDYHVLDLCKRNCDNNIGGSDESKVYSTLYLEWGKHIDFQEAFNTVIATDVIYNLEALEPLIQSAHALLLPGGYFILSHIPRASISSKLALNVALEHEILSCASKYKLESIFRGNVSEYKYICKNDYALRIDILQNIVTPNKRFGIYDWSSIQSVGAAIFIFKKSVIEVSL